MLFLKQARDFEQELSSQLAEFLLNRGELSLVKMDFARQKQAVEKVPLWRVLIDHGLIRERSVVESISELLGIEFVEIGNVAAADREILSLFNQELCLSSAFLPLRREGDLLVVLLGDAIPAEVSQIVLRRCGTRCRFLQAEFSRVVQHIRHSFFFAQNPLEELIDLEIKALSSDAESHRSPAELTNYLLHLAVRERATDIHITPAPRSLHILLRLDGVLSACQAIPASISRLVSYIKLRADMDISECRRPQDGSFHIRIVDEPMTVRVSTIVTDYGERVVMRLLPEALDLKGLTELGFYSEDADVIARAMSRPSGLVVVTGPTGSGKSSTLHAGLRMQQLIERNVLTVEDPIEYRVPGAAQTEVNRKAGYDFSTALRHFLRHDPDVILVGEMRDAETAIAAFDAAATGHLVLSTLHVTSVFGVLPRLRPMGLLPQVIAENLLLVINQRLVRRVCSACARATPFSASELAWLGGNPQHIEGQRGTGCVVCRGTGYFGRLPIYEMLPISDALADHISADARRALLRSAAREGGFTDLFHCARRRVLEGLTTVEEVYRGLGSDF